MILAELAQLGPQLVLNPRLEKALAFLQTHPAAEGLAERVEIDGTAVYALVQDYETIPAGDPVRCEAHRAYLDIQYVVSGEEGMGWAALEQLRDVTEYNPAKDVLHGLIPAAAMATLRVGPGQAAVFFPADAHAPKLAYPKPGRVKKIVVKVQL